MKGGLVERFNTSASATSLSWGDVIGIAAAGGAAILALAVVTAIVVVRTHRRHRHRRANSLETTDRRTTWNTLDFSSHDVYLDRMDDSVYPIPSPHSRRDMHACYPEEGGYVLKSNESLPIELNAYEDSLGIQHPFSRNKDPKFDPQVYRTTPPRRNSRRKRSTPRKRDAKVSHLSAILESPQAQGAEQSPKHFVPNESATSLVEEVNQAFARSPILKDMPRLPSPDSPPPYVRPSRAVKSSFTSSDGDVFRPDNWVMLRADRSFSVPSLVSSSRATPNTPRDAVFSDPLQQSVRSFSMSNLHARSGPSGPLPPLPAPALDPAIIYRPREGQIRPASCSTISSVESTGSSILNSAISPNSTAAADFSQRHPEMRLGYQIRHGETDLKAALIQPVSQVSRPSSRLSHRPRLLSGTSMLSTLSRTSSLEQIETAKAYRVSDSGSPPQRIKSTQTRSRERSRNSTRSPKRNRSSVNLNTVSAMSDAEEKDNPFKWSNATTPPRPAKKSALKGSPNSKKKGHKNKNSVTICSDPVILNPSESISTIEIHRPEAGAEIATVAEAVMLAPPENIVYELYRPPSIAMFAPDIMPEYRAVLPSQTTKPDTKNDDTQANARFYVPLHRNDSSPTSSVMLSSFPLSNHQHHHAAKTAGITVPPDSFPPLTIKDVQELMQVAKDLSPAPSDTSLTPIRWADRCIDPALLQSPQPPSPLHIQPRLRAQTTSAVTSIPSSQSAAVETTAEDTIDRPSSMFVEFHTVSGATVTDMAATDIDTAGDAVQLVLQNDKHDALVPPAAPTNGGALLVNATSPLDNRPNLAPPEAGVSLSPPRAVRFNAPLGPRAPPGQPLRSTVKALRRMDSDAGSGLSDSREGRRYLHIGREASPLLPPSPDSRTNSILSLTAEMASDGTVILPFKTANATNTSLGLNGGALESSSGESLGAGSNRAFGVESNEAYPRCDDDYLHAIAGVTEDTGRTKYLHPHAATKIVMTGKKTHIFRGTDRGRGENTLTTLYDADGFLRK